MASCLHVIVAQHFNGLVDLNKMKLDQRINPNKMSTNVLRHQDEQNKYRQKSRSINKDSQHANQLDH